MGAGPQRDRAAAGEVAAGQRLTAHHDAACREVGAGDDLEQFGHRRARFVDELDERPADLAEIMRRDARRHAHGDAAGPVDHQVREAARQHHRLGVALVVGRDEVDRVEFEVVEHHRRDRREPGLRVPHGGGGQAGNRAKVALLVDEHMPHVPFLGHADERRIDHALTVRMIVAAGVARDFGTLHAGRARREIQVVHGNQNPPLGGFQAVADIGQGSRNDHAHRVGQIAVLEFLLDRLLDQPAASIVSQHAGVVPPITRMARASPLRSRPFRSIAGLTPKRVIRGPIIPGHITAVCVVCVVCVVCQGVSPDFPPGVSPVGALEHTRPAVAVNRA